MFKKLAVAMCLALSGCGIIYVAPNIGGATDIEDLTILKMTPNIVAQANASQYTPRQIPSVFKQTAFAGGNRRGTGALPEPVVGQQLRPNLAETRLPAPLPNEPYIIGVGDVLLLATVQAATSIEELSGLLAAQNRRQGYTVQDDGAIAVPDVGRVQLAGLNLEEAEAAVFQALVENQLDPTFSIEVAEFNSKRVTVGGAVVQSTIVPITLTPLKLQEAIASAGGVVAADPEFVTIRLYRDGTLYQLPLGRLPNSDLTLQAGDSIFVDTDFELAKAQAYFEQEIKLTELRQSVRTQALAELQAEIGLRRAALNEERQNFKDRVNLDAVERDYAYLTGEVTRQGRLALPYGSKANLADALYGEAGGTISNTGNPRAIYLLRGDATGGVIAYNLDASNPINLVLATEMELRPNDIIFVGQQPVTKWNRVVQQIVPSLLLAGLNEIRNN